MESGVSTDGNSGAFTFTSGAATKGAGGSIIFSVGTGDHDGGEVLITAGATRAEKELVEKLR